MLISCNKEILLRLKKKLRIEASIDYGLRLEALLLQKSSMMFASQDYYLYDNFANATGGVSATNKVKTIGTICFTECDVGNFFSIVALVQYLPLQESRKPRWPDVQTDLS
jgi:hypothetical protein